MTILLDDLRNLLRDFWSGQGFEAIGPTGLVSRVFPTEFNMSAGHAYVLPRLQSEEEVPAPERVSVMERCLRRLDLGLIGYSTYHLLLFEMAVAARIEAASANLGLEDLVDGVLELFETLGLRRELLVITCSGGGIVGRHVFKADVSGRDLWIRQGVSPDRVLVVEGRRNLVFSQGENRPAGISHEIFYPIHNELVEVASINLYSHLQRGGNLIATANRAVGVGIGLERLAMTCNELNSVFDLPPLDQIVQATSGQTKKSLELLLYRQYFERLGETLRAIVFAISDGQTVDSSPRGKIVSHLLDGAEEMSRLIGIDFEEALRRAHQATVDGYERAYPHLVSQSSYVRAVCDDWIQMKGRARHLRTA